MLVSPSDFKVKIERTSNSSQSNSPEGRVLWEEISGRVLWEELPVVSRFQSYLRADEWNFCPLQTIEPSQPFHICSNYVL